MHYLAFALEAGAKKENQKLSFKLSKSYFSRIFYWIL